MNRIKEILNKKIYILDTNLEKMFKRRQNQNKENQENSSITEFKKSKTIETSSPSKNVLKPSQDNIIYPSTNEQHKNATPLIKTEPIETPAQAPTENQVDLDEAQYQTSLKQIKTIQQLLSSANSLGECSVGGEANELPVMLGLHIKQIGHVSLPLTPNQAESLAKVCKQAPYGLKYDTVYDKTVRDTYQLDPSEIEIKNETWNENLDKLVEKVAKDLGCSGKVKANLYKMLLYEKGGHFKKHRDTEKEKGMFGTLIIQLPSIYTGGELTVYGYGESKKSFDFGQSTGKAEYSIHYAAHYADLEHEVAEVKSGYRLVLIYNLCWADGNGTCLNNESLAERMKESLGILNESRFPIAMLLDHKYTEQALKTNGLKALKGIDNDRFNLLKHASDMLPLNKQSSFYLICATYFVCADDMLADCHGERSADRLPIRDLDEIYGDYSDCDDEDDYDRYYSTDEDSSDEDEDEEPVDFAKISNREKRKMLLFAKCIDEMNGDDDLRTLNQALSKFGMEKYEKPGEDELEDDEEEEYDFFGLKRDEHFETFLVAQMKKSQTSTDKVEPSKENVVTPAPADEIKDVSLNSSSTDDESESCDSRCDCNSEDSDNQV